MVKKISCKDIKVGDVFVSEHPRQNWTARKEDAYLVILEKQRRKYEDYYYVFRALLLNSKEMYWFYVHEKEEMLIL